MGQGIVFIIYVFNLLNINIFLDKNSNQDKLEESSGWISWIFGDSEGDAEKNTKAAAAAAINAAEVAAKSNPMEEMATALALAFGGGAALPVVGKTTANVNKDTKENRDDSSGGESVGYISFLDTEYGKSCLSLATPEQLRDRRRRMGVLQRSMKRLHIRYKESQEDKDERGDDIVTSYGYTGTSVATPSSSSSSVNEVSSYLAVEGIRLSGIETLFSEVLGQIALASHIRYEKEENNEFQDLKMKRKKHNIFGWGKSLCLSSSRSLESILRVLILYSGGKHDVDITTSSINPYLCPTTGVISPLLFSCAVNDAVDEQVRVLCTRHLCEPWRIGLKTERSGESTRRWMGQVSLPLSIIYIYIYLTLYYTILCLGCTSDAVLRHALSGPSRFIGNQ